MKKATLVLFAAVILTFGAAIVIPHIGARSASGEPVPVPKYPAVPEEEFFKNVIPDPNLNAGKICVSVTQDGEHLGTKIIDDVDFADPKNSDVGQAGGRRQSRDRHQDRIQRINRSGSRNRRWHRVGDVCQVLLGLRKRPRLLLVAV